MADGVAQAALERALDDEQQLVLLYQPIHDARSGIIYGAEALLRQRRQSGEVREASMIREAAEDSDGGELFRLDHILVRKAYTDAARWHGHGHDVHLNVNLSPREFQEGNVLDRLTSLVTTCGIDTSRVNLEITETSYIEHPEETVLVIDKLRERGLGIWLDDFGTGHSALNHLQHFDIDGLKLPGAFVAPLPDDRRCRALTRAILTLAGELGLGVIAEGVERRDQLDFLAEHGCTLIQGFLFSRPMAPDDFNRLLDSESRRRDDTGQATSARLSSGE